jgi:glycosyltransferase involved in cell wall biosynthesis
MPDHVPKGIVKAVQERSEVLPVPLEANLFTGGTSPSGGPLVFVWNHRWEHDKAPGRFFQALYKLRDKKIPFKVHVVGQRFRDCPPEFDDARERLRDNILTWGFVEDNQEYRSLLASSDLVISTALHDFQGLAVLEGVASGCRPVVPDRLAYPEFFPEEFRYASSEDDEEKEIGSLSGHLEQLCADPEATRQTALPDIGHLSWEELARKYREIIKEVADS